MILAIICLILFIVSLIVSLYKIDNDVLIIFGILFTAFSFVGLFIFFCVNVDTILNWFKI